MCMKCLCQNRKEVMKRLKKAFKGWEGVTDSQLPMSEQLEPLLKDLLVIIKEMPSEKVILGEDPDTSEEFLEFLGNFAKFVGAAHYLIRLMMTAPQPGARDFRELIIHTRAAIDFLYTCLQLPDAPTLQMENFAAHAVEALRNHLVGEPAQEEPVDKNMLN